MIRPWNSDDRSNLAPTSPSTMDVKKRATAPPGQAGSSTAREREDKNLSLSRLRLSLLFYSFAAASSVYLILLRTPYASYVPYAEEGFSGFTDMLKNLVDSGLTGNINGHVDFGDGRKTAPAMAFCRPKSEALSYVNVMLGNGGWGGEKLSLTTGQSRISAAG